MNLVAYFVQEIADFVSTGFIGFDEFEAAQVIIRRPDFIAPGNFCA
jgi:hypothetical protein